MEVSASPETLSKMKSVKSTFSANEPERHTYVNQNIESNVEILRRKSRFSSKNRMDHNR